MSGYVHGYSDTEQNRLNDQASTLAELLHWDTIYPAGSRVLEAGCGVGAQTIILAEKSPSALITSVDISDESVASAKEKISSAGFDNVTFQQGDIFDLEFPDASFDHVFVCFVLEHLKAPVDALAGLKRFLKPGGTITVIEGDHGSAYFHPDSAQAQKAIQCQIDLQAQAGGNALIGRALYPLLVKSGYSQVKVSPRMVYVDSSRPNLVDGFIKKTFTAMVEGVREQALSRKLVDRDIFDKGIRDLYRTAEPDGTFCYTFFKAVGITGD
jgi:ubiquinone/menaquinone biosynthesis C-methylase UbiE